MDGSNSIPGREGMPSEGCSSCPSMEKILFIDEMSPLLIAFREVFRTVNPRVTVSYVDNFLCALSGRVENCGEYGLIIIGSQWDVPCCLIELRVRALRIAFPGARIMVYSTGVTPFIRKMTENSTVDACFHLFEPVDEMKEAYRRALEGKGYISPILRTQLV
jgi:hypothetical protein